MPNVNVNEQLSIDRRRLFFAANLSMFMVGLGFAARANIASAYQANYSIVSISLSGEHGRRGIGHCFSGLR